MDLHTPLATARLDHILHEVTQVADERYPALEYIQRVAWAAGVELHILRTDRQIDVVAGWAAASRHVGMRTALLPVITVIGLEFAFLLGGLLVTEQVFNLNGIGKLMVDAVVRRDYTMTQALIMLVASAFVVTNFLIDQHARLRARIAEGALGQLQLTHSLFASMVLEYYRANPQAYADVFKWEITGP